LALVFLLACSSSSTSDVADAPPGATADARAGAVDAAPPQSIDAGACATTLSSCLTVTCCDGLVCCTGNPVPPGQALCYPSMCPY